MSHLPRRDCHPNSNAQIKSKVDFPNGRPKQKWEENCTGLCFKTFRVLLQSPGRGQVVCKLGVVFLLIFFFFFFFVHGLICLSITKCGEIASDTSQWDEIRLTKPKDEPQERDHSLFESGWVTPGISGELLTGGHLLSSAGGSVVCPTPADAARAHTRPSLSTTLRSLHYP